MDQLIYLIIYVVIFATVGYALFWICDRAGFPEPVRWIVGAILLIVVLLFLANQIGGGTAFHLGR